MTNTENNGMTEGLYMESMEHLQQLYKKYEAENEKILEENRKLKEILTALYGVIKMLYCIMDMVEDVDLICFNILEGLVSYLNQKKEYIFN